MSKLKASHDNLLNAIYAIDGIIVVNGVDGKAISSPDPEQPLKVKGKELAKLGLDLVLLLRSEMILPVTNQDSVDEALRYFEEQGNVENVEVGESSVDNDEGRRVTSRRRRSRRNNVNA